MTTRRRADSVKPVFNTAHRMKDCMICRKTFDTGYTPNANAYKTRRTCGDKTCIRIFLATTRKSSGSHGRAARCRVGRDARDEEVRSLMEPAAPEVTESGTVPVFRVPRGIGFTET